MCVVFGPAIGALCLPVLGWGALLMAPSVVWVVGSPVALLGGFFYAVCLQVKTKGLFFELPLGGRLKLGLVASMLTGIVVHGVMEGATGVLRLANLLSSSLIYVPPSLLCAALVKGRVFQWVVGTAPPTKKEPDKGL